MSTPNELAKVIERVENELNVNGPEGEGVTFANDIQQLLLAAKRLKEVEKERDELKRLRKLDIADSSTMKLCEEYQQQLSTLRIEYKKALEELRFRYPDSELLQHPHAIEAMKGGR